MKHRKNLLLVTLLVVISLFLVSCTPRVVLQAQLEDEIAAEYDLPFGTEYDDAELGLPQTITARIVEVEGTSRRRGGSDTVTLNVVWTSDEDFDKDTPGDYDFTYTLEKMPGETKEFIIAEEDKTGEVTVKVLPPKVKEGTVIGLLDDITIEFGEELNLPVEVDAELEDESIVTLDVEWVDLDGFDNEKAGEYNFEYTLSPKADEEKEFIIPASIATGTIVVIVVEDLDQPGGDIDWEYEIVMRTYRWADEDKEEVSEVKSLDYLWIEVYIADAQTGEKVYVEGNVRLTTNHDSLFKDLVVFDDPSLMEHRVLYQPDVVNEDTLVRIQATFFRAEGDGTDDIRVGGAAKAIMVTPIKADEGEITRRKITAVDAQQADRITLYFDRPISASEWDLYTSKAAREALTVYRTVDNTYDGDREYAIPIKGFLSVPGNLSAIIAILDVDYANRPMSNNQTHFLHVEQTPFYEASTDEDHQRFVLRDSNAPRMVEVWSRDPRTIFVRFSESVLNSTKLATHTLLDPNQLRFIADDLTKYVLNGVDLGNIFNAEIEVLDFDQTRTVRTFSREAVNNNTLTDQRHIVKITLPITHMLPKEFNRDDPDYYGEINNLEVAGRVGDWSAYTYAPNVTVIDDYDFQTTPDTKIPNVYLVRHSPEQFLLLIDKEMDELLPDPTEDMFRITNKDGSLLLRGNNNPDPDTSIVEESFSVWEIPLTTARTLVYNNKLHPIYPTHVPEHYDYTGNFIQHKDPLGNEWNMIAEESLADIQVAYLFEINTDWDILYDTRTTDINYWLPSVNEYTLHINLQDMFTREASDIVFNLPLDMKSVKIDLEEVTGYPRYFGEEELSTQRWRIHTSEPVQIPGLIEPRLTPNYRQQTTTPISTPAIRFIRVKDGVDVEEITGQIDSLLRHDFTFDIVPLKPITLDDGHWEVQIENLTDDHGNGYETKRFPLTLQHRDIPIVSPVIDWIDAHWRTNYKVIETSSEMGALNSAYTSLGTLPTFLQNKINVINNTTNRDHWRFYEGDGELYYMPLDDRYDWIHVQFNTDMSQSGEESVLRPRNWLVNGERIPDNKARINYGIPFIAGSGYDSITIRVDKHWLGEQVLDQEQNMLISHEILRERNTSTLVPPNTLELMRVINQPYPNAEAQHARYIRKNPTTGAELYVIPEHMPINAFSGDQTGYSTDATLTYGSSTSRYDNNGTKLPGSLWNEYNNHVWFVGEELFIESPIREVSFMNILQHLSIDVGTSSIDLNNLTVFGTTTINGAGSASVNINNGGYNVILIEDSDTNIRLMNADVSHIIVNAREVTVDINGLLGTTELPTITVHANAAPTFRLIGNLADAIRTAGKLKEEFIYTGSELEVTSSVSSPTDHIVHDYEFTIYATILATDDNDVKINPDKPVEKLRLNPNNLKDTDITITARASGTAFETNPIGRIVVKEIKEIDREGKPGQYAITAQLYDNGIDTPVATEIDLYVVFFDEILEPEDGYPKWRRVIKYPKVTVTPQFDYELNGALTVTASDTTAGTATLEATLNRPGRVWIVVLEKGKAQPNAVQVRAGVDGNNDPAIFADVQDINTKWYDPDVNIFNVTGLESEGEYDVWLYAEDDQIPVTPENKFGPKKHQFQLP